MSAAVARSEEPPVVKSVEFRGLKRISEGAPRAKVSHKTGEQLDFAKIADDVKNIYSMGHFEDVKAETEPFEGGVRLIYVVREKPMITRVDFRGNVEVEDSKIKETATITSGSPADIALIQENADKLTKLYESLGFPMAKVVPVMRRTGEDTVFLTYQIEEGDSVRLREIYVRGNYSVDENEILNAIKTSEWWIFSFMTESGRYDSGQMALDAETIKEIYQDKGFMKAEVPPPTTKFTEDGKWMDVFIYVREGTRYKVAGIEFEESPVFEEKIMREKVKSSTGRYISKKTLRDDSANVAELFTEKGYALASVYPDLVPEGPDTLKIVFRISEGDIYDIGRVHISGNQKTRDKVVRREVLVNEGERYNSKLLKRSYQKIYNLNLFETVDIKPLPNPERRTVDLSLTLKERPSGSLSVGAGYSSLDGLVAMIDITEGNLGGRGQYIKLKADFSSRSTTYELSFRDPWFMNYPVSFTTSVYNTKREFVNYDKKATGFTLGFGKRFKDYWSAHLLYSFEESTIFNIKSTASSLIRSQEGTKQTSSITPSITRDTRDNFLDPHSGSQHSLFVTYAGVGGDNRFIKTVIDSSWYLPVTERTTLSLHGTFGAAEGIGQDLPLYERFYVGGIYSIRGLGFGEAGPRDENNAVIGGTKKVIFNAEYSFPLIPEAGLKGLFFYDTGGAYDDPSEFRFRRTGGGGIRWISPIGPIRLEYGRNLSRRGTERESRWEFAFGTFF